MTFIMSLYKRKLCVCGFKRAILHLCSDLLSFIFIYNHLIVLLIIIIDNKAIYILISSIRLLYISLMTCGFSRCLSSSVRGQSMLYSLEVTGRRCEAVIISSQSVCSWSKETLSGLGRSVTQANASPLVKVS